MPDTLSEVWKAAQTARTMAVPVFTRTFGADASIADLDLQIVTPDDIAFTGQKLPIRARVRHPGFPAGTTTEITLSSGDGKILATQPITFTDEESALVEFPIKAGLVGIQRFALEVKPLPQEIVRANNSGVFYLRVIDTPIRVLDPRGQAVLGHEIPRPRPGRVAGRHRDIRRAAEGRPRAHAPQRVEGAGEEPGHDAERRSDAPCGAGGAHRNALGARRSCSSRSRNLKEYDVIILGRDVDSFLDRDSVENLCRWVGEWGGSLVCARGRPLQVVPASLDRVMPVRWQTGMERRFRVNLTRDAEWGFPAFPPAAPLMPSLASDAESIVEKPLATVLARPARRAPPPRRRPSEPDEGKNPMAVASYQPYGSGRVIVFEGSGLWRWAFLPRAETARQDIYPRFWNSLLRWLVASGDFLPGETARLRASQTTFTEMDPPSLFLMTRNDPEIGAENSAPTVEIRSLTDPQGFPPRRVACAPAGARENLYRATCGPLPVGAYVARLERARGGGNSAPDASHGSGSPPRSVECAFDVTEPTAEWLDLRARPGLMKQLAELSGGAVLGDRPAEQVRKTYLEYWKERHPEEFHREPAWDRTAFLVALAAVAGALWIVRRRGGLV